MTDERRAGGQTMTDILDLARETLAYAERYKVAGEPLNWRQPTDNERRLAQEVIDLQVFRDAIRDCGKPDKWEVGDPRMSYVTVQIDKEDWNKCCAALEGRK